MTHLGHSCCDWRVQVVVFVIIVPKILAVSVLHTGVHGDVEWLHDATICGLLLRTTTSRFRNQPPCPIRTDSIPANANNSSLFLLLRVVESTDGHVAHRSGCSKPVNLLPHSLELRLFILLLPHQPLQLHLLLLSLQLLLHHCVLRLNECPLLRQQMQFLLIVLLLR